jgi:hypothetical protein
VGLFLRERDTPLEFKTSIGEDPVGIQDPLVGMIYLDHQDLISFGFEMNFYLVYFFCCI